MDINFNNLSFAEVKISLLVLLVFMLLDLITGTIKAIYKKELNSTKMREGLMKKGFEMVLVLMSHLLSILISVGEILDITVIFLIAQEGISVLENMSEYIPIPKIIKSVLEQCKNKGGEIDERSSE